MDKFSRRRNQIKEDYTHIVIVRDCSTSMSGIAKAMDEELQSFLYAQAKAPGVATVSLYDFSSEGGWWAQTRRLEYKCEAVRRVFDFAPLHAMFGVEPLIADGNTPLWDAEGTAIKETGVSLANMREDLRPSKVIVVVISDGEENSSRIYSQSQVNQMIQTRTGQFNWQFTFIGANIDARETAKGVGIKAQSALQFAPSAQGVKHAFESLTNGTIRARSMDHAQYCNAVQAGSFYTEKEQEQGDNDAKAASGDNLQGSSS